MGAEEREGADANQLRHVVLEKLHGCGRMRAKLVQNWQQIDHAAGFAGAGRARWGWEERLGLRGGRMETKWTILAHAGLQLIQHLAQGVNRLEKDLSVDVEVGNELLVGVEVGREVIGLGQGGNQARHGVINGLASFVVTKESGWDWTGPIWLGV